MAFEEVDSDLSVKNNTYTIKKEKQEYLLKKIKIKKEKLKYSFIGGMWYTHDTFSFDQNISLPFPFSTYYTYKILDKEYENQMYRSLIYVKAPLMILQLKDQCYCIEFDSVVQIKGEDVFPFIGLSEDDSHYIISFYLFDSIDIKHKQSAWLGRGKKETLTINLSKGDNFSFAANLSTYDTWEDAVSTFMKKQLSGKKPAIENPQRIFQNAKQALWRSYDDISGSFLQLPWKYSPGFTFQHSSYSLLSYEAVRLDYFSKWNKELKDEQLDLWIKKLEKHFINPELYSSPSKQGDGIIWYNMTNLTKHGLQGYFYMDCGYAGYPGGQATIALHLLRYIQRTPNGEIKKIVKQSLKYILSTQKKDGSWPMAIKQEGIIRFRPEKLSEYTSHGGTAEAVQALLLASTIYKSKKYMKSAEKALSYLKTSHPICYNGLRDIGIMEPEAFSTVSVIHAFLDGYDHTKNEEYLQQAYTYSMYLVTWIYLYDTQQWNLRYDFHPISYSITPRLSPYESVWVVSTFLRLYTYSKKDFWLTLARLSYNAVLPWISSNGGLSEGVFPQYQGTLESLPMEQTFATAELMNASYQFMQKDQRSQLLKKEIQKKDKKIQFKKEKDVLLIEYNNTVICKIKSSTCQIIYLHTVDLGPQGISFSFNGPYSMKNKVKQKMKKHLRGPSGKYLLGVKDATYAVTGVKPPKTKQHNTIDYFSNHIVDHNIEITNNNAASIQCSSIYHKITMNITAYKKDKKFVISINPLTIQTLAHDLETTKMFIPLIDSPVTKLDEKTLSLPGCTLEGDFQTIQSIDNQTGIDKTLATNWTHGGIYKGEFIINLDQL